MKVIARAAIVAACLIVAGCRGHEGSTPPAVPTQIQSAPAPSPPADPDVLKRMKLRDRWVAAAELVTRKTGDEEARKLLVFLKLHSILSRPHEVGAVVVERCQEAPGFVLIPLCPGDETTSSDWYEKATNENFAANFVTDPGALIVRPTPTTPLWRGIIILHETRHAYRATYSPGEQDEKAYCEEERDTHEFENRLVAKLGGHPYAALVEREVRLQRRRLAQRGGEAGESFTSRASDFPQLDRVFGKPASEFERKVRATHVWIHALFRWVEEDYHGDVEGRKALIMRAIYREDGVLERR